MEYHSVMKKKLILSFATIWMGEDGIMLTSKLNRERQLPQDFTYMWDVRNKREVDPKTEIMDCWYPLQEMGALYG